MLTCPCSPPLPLPRLRACVPQVADIKEAAKKDRERRKGKHDSLSFDAQRRLAALGAPRCCRAVVAATAVARWGGSRARCPAPASGSPRPQHACAIQHELHPLLTPTPTPTTAPPSADLARDLRGMRLEAAQPARWTPAAGTAAADADAECQCQCEAEAEAAVEPQVVVATTAASAPASPAARQRRQRGFTTLPPVV